jgi:serine/threonine protein kinase
MRAQTCWMLLYKNGSSRATNAPTRFTRCGCSEARCRTGTVRWPRCTLAYAPPNVVLAVRANQEVPVSPAQDVWALGVMAFEVIVQRVTLTTMLDISECANGARPYPWEAEPAVQPPAWRQSRLRALLAPCLARDPAQRPTAAQLLQEVGRIGHASTMRT